MMERGWIEPIVDRVVGEVLEGHAAQLRSEIARRVMEEIAAEPEMDSRFDASFATDLAPSASVSSELARAVSQIQRGTSQREILRALLDTSARYAARVALFVVKGSRATGWQARGFANNDAIKDFPLDENSPAVVQAISRPNTDRNNIDRNSNNDNNDRMETSVPASDLDARFLDEVGIPVSGESQLLPLILKDKVAALIYADSGIGAAGLLDPSALGLLVLSTSAWLEVNSLRKQAQKEPSVGHSDGHNLAATGAPLPPPIHKSAAPAPAFNDPFAPHAPAYAPSHAMAAAASSGDRIVPVGAAVETPALSHQFFDSPPAIASEPSEVQTEVQTEVQAAGIEMEPPPAAAPQPFIGHAETVAAAAESLSAGIAPEVSPGISSEDQDLHRKAQRFARLLVDEIKLYNQAKVDEGRKNKDLYDLLQDVIEKSRVTYQKRYGSTVAASANYFEREIIRGLAEDDPSLMGNNFRQ
jgi:hypothetical protein